MASTAAVYTLASKVKMSNGQLMPQIHLGLYMMSGTEARKAVASALAAGYRGFDCAQMYHNEKQAGEALLAYLKKSQQEGTASSPLTRQDIFYTSKLAENSTAYDTVRRSIRRSVAACGLGYIDLFLLHSPYGGREARLVSWKAVEDAIDAGELRAGGVSNYGVAHIEELMAVARIPPVVNQIEVHPFNTRTDIRAVCAKHNILIEAYAPLVRGLRMRHPTVQSLARRYACTPAQLLVRWSLQHGMVPLPKTVSPARMVENADVNGFAISADDMATLDALDEYLVTDW